MIDTTHTIQGLVDKCLFMLLSAAVPYLLKRYKELMLKDVIIVDRKAWEVVQRTTPRLAEIIVKGVAQ